MSKAAIGRDAVIARRDAPAYGAASSWRSIPPEPDELWDALLLMERLEQMTTSLAGAAGARLYGLVAERARARDELAHLLGRLTLSGDDLLDISRDLAPCITAVNLARIGEVEIGDERLASNGDALIVTLKGKGFGHEATRALRIEYVNVNGASRVIPLTETRHTQDLELVEWAAVAPLAAQQAVVGSVVAIVLDVTLRSDRRVVRCVERFTLG